VIRAPLLCSLLALLAGAARAADSPAGKELFARHCAVCHAAGPGHPGTERLAESRGADRAVLEQRKDLVPAYIRLVVRRGLIEMPPWRESEISEAQLEQLVRYLAPGAK